MITVIINVYNGEKYIKKCLDSIINQTYKDLEILIINDGSTDKTLSICKKYKDSRIRIIDQKNKGLSLSRNVGIDNAKGEFLYFVDADDFIEFDTLEYLYNLCIKYNKDISSCRHQNIYNYDYKKEIINENIEELNNKEMLKKIFLKENTVTLWNKLIKKKLFCNLRFEDRIINDVAFTHKLVMKTDKIVLGNEVKYYHLKNINRTSAVRYEDYDRIIDLYNATIERYDYVNKAYPDFIENNYAALELIIQLYRRKNKRIINYLNENGAIKMYKKLFSFKVLKCRISHKQKINLLLFRISPKLNRTIFGIYLNKLKKKEVI